MYFKSGRMLNESMNKSCIIISPYFPPSTLAGVHRARHLAKHLPAAGWNPIVLCVDEAHHEERLDSSLAGLVPETVEVIKVAAVSARLTRPLGMGEISLRAFFHLRRRLLQLLETRKIDCVFITGSPYYPMLLSGEVKRKFDVPVVLDFQDPWVSAWGATQPKFSKNGISHIIARIIEPRVLRNARFVTSVSETQNAELSRRYSWLDAGQMAAIPIGSDSQDFSALEVLGNETASAAFDSESFNISYVGTIWPAVLPTLRVFLRAIAQLSVRHPSTYKRLKLNFVGTTANPNDRTGYRVLPLAKAEGVADIIHEVPQRIPYLQALTVLKKSDASLMLGSNEPHYTASKIYPYLMSGRPFFSLFHRASSAHEVLIAAGGGIPLCFSNNHELTDLEREICDGLHVLATNPGSLGLSNPEVYSPYEAEQIAIQYAEVFDSVCRVGNS
jgi:hypothetical protein